MHRIILVTGGTGLVGTSLAEDIKETKVDGTWIFLSRQDGDLRDLQQTKTLFEKHTPTHVIHLAAKVGGLYSNISQPVEFFVDNMRVNMNVLQCAAEYGVSKVISCLSTCIFPDQTSYPMDETMIHDGPPHCSNEGYAYAKRMLDVLNRAYSKKLLNKSCFTSIVPTNIYGPHDNFDLKDAHVIPALIQQMYMAKNHETPLTVCGTGKPLRQFLYSRDLARLIVWILNNYDQVDPIILAGSEDSEVSIQDVVDTLVRIADFKGEISYDTSKADGQQKKTVSNKKLQSLCPGFRFTSLEEGLRETWEWFVKRNTS